MLNILILSVF